MFKMNDDEVYVIEFTNPLGGSLGRLTFEKDKLEFQGVADECAKQFLEELKKQWQEQKQ